MHLDLLAHALIKIGIIKLTVVSIHGLESASSTFSDLLVHVLVVKVSSLSVVLPSSSRPNKQASAMLDVHPLACLIWGLLLACLLDARTMIACGHH